MTELIKPTRFVADDGTIGTAVISHDGVYRYDLTRSWGNPGDPVVAFVMLNPSKADERITDPTVTRCIGFAKNWGFGGLIVRNCFALRSTEPIALRGDVDPIGPDNDAWLGALVDQAQQVIAAWGVDGKLYGRHRTVRRILAAHPAVHHLGLTKGGYPKHPLYLAAATIPTRWQGVTA